MPGSIGQTGWANWPPKPTLVASTPEDAEQLASFMEHVNGNLAREAGRLIGWRGRFWRERYHLIPISPETDALVERLHYVLSNTIKENLVATTAEWEGLHCAQALIEGKPLKGIWYARAEEYEAKRLPRHGSRALARDDDSAQKERSQPEYGCF